MTCDYVHDILFLNFKGYQKTKGAIIFQGKNYVKCEKSSPCYHMGFVGVLYRPNKLPFPSS